MNSKRICTAAVKVKIKKTGQELIIPCHRHADGFYCLKLFGYKPDDYIILGTGFLDQHRNYYDRIAAYQIAVAANQIQFKVDSNHELFSEDLW